MAILQVARQNSDGEERVRRGVVLFDGCVSGSDWDNQRRYRFIANFPLATDPGTW